jgi:hypothetical protein
MPRFGFKATRKLLKSSVDGRIRAPRLLCGTITSHLTTRVALTTCDVAEIYSSDEHWRG